MSEFYPPSPTDYRISTTQASVIQDFVFYQLPSASWSNRISKMEESILRLSTLLYLLDLYSQTREAF